MIKTQVISLCFCWHSCQFCFTAVPVRCQHDCTCHNDPVKDVNVFNCSAQGLSHLPAIPEKTDWLDLSNNGIQTIDEVFQTYNQTYHIDFSGNNIAEFNENLSHHCVQHLDLRNNSLQQLSHTLTEQIKVKELLLSGNPFQCHCDMLWMQRWLQNLLHERNFVPDSKNIICGPGPLSGKAIYELNSDILQCSLQWYWIVAVASCSVAVFVTVALLLHRNWERLRFLLFLHFDILATDDGVESLDEMHYDGFVCYRYQSH